MTDRWLQTRGHGAVAFGGASLLGRLSLVQLGATPLDLGIHPAVGALAGRVGGFIGGWLVTFGSAVAFGAAGLLALIGSALVVTLRARTDG